MLLLHEIRLTTSDRAEPGDLVLRWRNKEAALHCLVVTMDGEHKTLFNLDRLSFEPTPAHLPVNLLSLGPPVVRVDEDSALPEGEFYPRGALVVQEGCIGIFEPGRQVGGRGRLITMDGRYVEFEQGRRDIGFSHFSVGFMRRDQFVERKAMRVNAMSL